MILVHKFYVENSESIKVCNYKILTQTLYAGKTRWVRIAQLLQWVMWWTGGVEFLARERHFLCSTASRLPVRPTKPPIQWVLVALSPGVKRPRHEADHPFSIKCQGPKFWSYISTPPNVFMSFCLIIYALQQLWLYLLNTRILLGWDFLLASMYDDQLTYLKEPSLESGKGTTNSDPVPASQASTQWDSEYKMQHTNMHTVSKQM
jgi:hypothetical protein